MKSTMPLSRTRPKSRGWSSTSGSSTRASALETKAPTGEIVFIPASVVQGAEVLMVGTDAWAQVVSDHARAQGGIEREEPGDETRGDKKGTRRRRTGWPGK